ncbi:MAG TPA: oligosaccharide flippase family protein [Candidatus Baltobacteraceae bacterium]|jgi:O-antigen/teichoic acid export membrane protein
MSSIAKKSIETFVARTVMQAFGILGGIVIARELGAQGKGVFSYAQTVFQVILMLYAGQAAAISWQYGKRARSSLPVFTSAMKVFVWSAVPIAAAVGVVAFAAPDQRILYAVAVALPFALFSQLCTGFFLADSNVRVLNIQMTFPTIVASLAYVVLLVFAHAGVQTLLAAWAATYICGAAYSAITLLPTLERGNDAQERGLVREQVTYGSQISINSVVSYLNFRIDVFLVLFMLGQTQLGIYSVGIAIGEVMFQLSRPIVTSAFGRIARGEKDEAASLTATCMRHSVVLVVAASVVAFFIGPALVTAVYGESFAGAGPVLRMLLPGIVAYSMMPVLATFFAQQLGSPRIPLTFSSISTVLCALITAATLKHFGILGAAAATSTSYGIAFGLAVAYFSRRTGLSVRQIFAFSMEDVKPYRRVALHAIAWPGSLVARWGGGR